MSGDTTHLATALARRLEDEPAGIACRLVAADGSSTPVTVERLVRKAMAYAEVFATSKERGITAVCLYHGVDLHAAFLGGLWAGHIPTMLPPPSPRMDAGKYTDSFRRMLQHVQPAWLVISSDAHAK